MNANDQYGMIRIVNANGAALTTAAVGDADGNRLRVTSGAIYDPASDSGAHVSAQGLDSPNTTNQIEYKLQFLIASGSLYMNRVENDPNTAESARQISTLTIMEVLA